MINTILESIGIFVECKQNSILNKNKKFMNICVETILDCYKMRRDKTRKQNEKDFNLWIRKGFVEKNLSVL